jgi:hypothetical protein
MENQPVPMTGTIQCTLERAHQPNQKRQMGMQKAPTNAGGRRSSGRSSSLSLSNVHEKLSGLKTRQPIG